MTHKDLEVWKKSMSLVEKIYTITKKLPKVEKFGLISQIRRASISIPSNIAEGAARGSTKEFLRYLNIANGSLSELETQLLLSQRLGYFDKDINIFNELDSISKMLYKLKLSLKDKI